MCKCNIDLFTKEEYNNIITNDYEFCQGYYKNLNQNLMFLDYLCLMFEKMNLFYFY